MPSRRRVADQQEQIYTELDSRMDLSCLSIASLYHAGGAHSSPAGCQPALDPHLVGALEIKQSILEII